MKDLTKTFLNSIDTIKVVGWLDDKPNRKEKSPTHGGNLEITFQNGDSFRFPLSYWFNPTPINNRPQISGTLDLYKMDMIIDTIEKFTGDCPIDNPSLRNNRVARTDDEYANRDEVHDKATAKKITPPNTTEHAASLARLLYRL